VYLSDFGMSQAFPPGQVIAPDQAAGTLDYLAPEQIEGRDLDGRADQYSLACTGYELLCGTPPFGPDQGQTLMYAQIYADPPAASARRAGIPAAVDSVLATALAKDPADRYPSCGRFAEELRTALGLRPVSAGRVLLRVKKRPPGTKDSQATGEAPHPARKAQQAAGEDPHPTGEDPRAAGEDPRAAGEDPHVAATDRPAGMGVPEPAATDDPRGPDPEPSARRIWTRGPVLAAGAAIVAAAAVVSGVALSGRSTSAHPAASTPAPTASSPSPSASPSLSSPSATASPSGPVTASQQAAALSALLTSSAAARTALHNAVTQVGACTNLSGAVGQLQAVENQRAGQYGRALALPTAALPGGAQVKSKLLAALGSSLTADRDYVSWARQQLTGGCTPSSQSSAYNAAFSASQRADAAKQAFVQVWNPVAARYGIAQKSPRDI
jgi:serine/threonine protein kinase